MKNTKISDAELEIMEVAWSLARWFTINDLIAALGKEKNWKYTTVATFVSRLTDKGILELKKQGWGNVYRPLLTKKEYKKQETQAFLQSIHHGSEKSLIASLYEGTLSDEAMHQLLDLIEKG